MRSEIVLHIKTNIFLGIIRDEKNPYNWINAYTKKNLKFESWSNTIEITKPAACMTSNGDWNTEDNCVPFCIEPLPEVLSLVFMKFLTRANSQFSLEPYCMIHTL